jgi:hypothetical protein
LRYSLSKLWFVVESSVVQKDSAYFYQEHQRRDAHKPVSPKVSQDNGVDPEKVVPVHLLRHFILALHQEILDIKICTQIGSCNQRYLEVVFMHRQKAFVVIKEFPRLRVIAQIRILISPVRRVIDNEMMSVRSEVWQEILLIFPLLLFHVFFPQRGNQPIVKNEPPESMQDYEKDRYNEVLLNEQAQVSFLLVGKPVFRVLQLGHNVCLEIKHHFFYESRKTKN